MKTIALLFAIVMAGVVPAEAKVPCKMPLYVATARNTIPGMADNTGSLFLYGLKTAVTEHQGCLVDRMQDAQLDLFVTTIKMAGEDGSDGSSVVAVALAVPLNGVPVYMDNYVLLIRNSDSIDGQVNGLLESIGETLDRHSMHGD